MGDTASAIMQGISLAAQGIATGMKIEEAKSDYQAQIDMLQTQKTAKISAMDEAAGRNKELGIAGINEKSASANYDTQMATMKAELTSSSAEAKLGASGVRAGGSALMAAQQQTDIAYAAADRTAEAGAAGVKIGGLQLGDTLKTAASQKSLLTLEYGQSITEAQRKKDYLNANEGAMMALGAVGGLAGLPSSFYQTVFGK
jgi:hypothetical protein